GLTDNMTWIFGSGPRTQISQQPVLTADATGPGEAAPVGVRQAACELRNVGTFGVSNNAAATDALEIRIPANVAKAPTRSEGRAGFNVPSLYGLALGAPYLHHGQASTLADLFTNPAFGFHTNASNANFSLTLAEAGKLDDLLAFLVSIDANTPEITMPVDLRSGSSFDVCPLTFP
ncbi:MAG TPA: hypothetical protein VLM79_37485, partial [Kofleriaceae bacterium]|nr:hypothetical protein [Kofleriaceae bacterium]